MEQHYPILEYDPTPEAIYSPQHHIVRSADVPERCVLCFFHDVIAALHQSGAAVPVATLGSELGPNPVYRIEVAGEAVALVHPGVGAPMAAFFLEELIARGQVGASAHPLPQCGRQRFHRRRETADRLDRVEQAARLIAGRAAEKLQVVIELAEAVDLTALQDHRRALWEAAFTGGGEVARGRRICQ